MSGTHILASTPSPAITDPIFVFHIDVVLLSLFAVYAALTLPRALVRLFQPSEILNGIFLRSGSSRPHNNTNLHRADTHGRSGTTRTRPLRSTSTRTNQTMRTLVDVPEDEEDVAGGVAMAKSKNKARPALIIPPRAAAATTTGGTGRRRSSRQSTPLHNRRAPTRVPRWTTIVHPTLVYALNFRVSPGFSFGKLFVLIVYAVLMLYASLRHSNPFADPVRTGYVAMSQIPIAVALAGKTNWLSWASGVGYEKLNYIHRFAGRVIVITANVHTVGYLYAWSLNGTLRAQLHVPKFMWGLIAICAVDLLFACTLSFVRNRMYTLFFSVHVTGVTVFLFATYKHSHATLPYILAAVGLYVFDHLARIARTRYTTAWLTAEHALNGGTTLVHVPSLGAGWRAGQHVRLRVVSRAWFGWWATWLVNRARPFTIAAGSNSSGMMLPVKAQGSWTRGLLRMSGDAADARPEEKFTDIERGRGPAREVRVIVEGPYSGPGYTLYTAYSGALLVAGGSGISYVMSVLDDMLRKHACGRSRVRVIEVIWSIANPDSLYSLLPELTPLMQPRSSPHTSLSLRFNVHWTRASAGPPRVPRTALPAGMYLRAGRPDIFATLQSVIAGVRTAYSHKQSGTSDDVPSGVVIGSCGPVALIDDAARAVGRVNWADWNDVGGVESIEEVFGW
ncbi:ferric reductase like transmembrane component-domain-containing protein [Russula earlei]|uniref:Ferric reductase like transmembrane component-domain-containing protein n=1 Tax=Russula earlei TaxID=71964 RepID=A0ACC0TXK4_9AGAM|nr:ferric reductase like transmembrane component-domain-containing protein [Russula earlei]